jgi:hypothetical protein
MAPSSSQDARKGVHRRQYLTVRVSSQHRTGDLQDQHQQDPFQNRTCPAINSATIQRRMQDLGQSQATPHDDAETSFIRRGMENYFYRTTSPST